MNSVTAAACILYFYCFLWIEITSTTITATEMEATMSLAREECKLRPIIHHLKYPGCVPKSIPSFACQGQCSSYVQVSGSKFWQLERSCMCCDAMGEREATTGIFCPKQTPKFRKIVTRAPTECMCRPCTGIDEKSVHPQELIDVILSRGTDVESLPSLHPSTKTIVME